MLFVSIFVLNYEYNRAKPSRVAKSSSLTQFKILGLETLLKIDRAFISQARTQLYEK